MINKVSISAYKCLYDEHLEFKPLTIITGLNSTGKSSLIQSILFPIAMSGANGRGLLNQMTVFSFDAIRNRYLNFKEVKASYWVNQNEVAYSWADGKLEISEPVLDIEHNLYYLSANRIGAEQHSKLSPLYKVGVNGEYLLGTFEAEKSKSLLSELIKDDSSFTLILLYYNRFFQTSINIPLSLLMPKLHLFHTNLDIFLCSKEGCDHQ